VDRRSLHLDYTRAIQKTPTPINGECTRTKTLLDSESASPSGVRCAQVKCANRPQHAMKTRDVAKTHMASAFPHSHKNRIAVDARQKNLRHPQARVAANQDAVSFPPAPKIFFHRPAFGRIVRTVNRSKRANRSFSRFAERCERAAFGRSIGSPERPHRWTIERLNAVCCRRRTSGCAAYRDTGVRDRASPSEDRSPPADWPCRPMLSSPGRRTSRWPLGSSWRPRPCPGSWRRSRPRSSRSRRCR
jgi:hypothetical protein